MKKHTKTRILCTLFAFLFILSQASLLSVTAEAALTLQDGLIVHYDFDGHTQAEQLANKGTGNIGALTFKNSGASSIANGVAYVDHSAGNALSVSVKDTVLQTANDLTIYAVFKPVDYADIGSARNLVEILNITNTAMNSSTALRWSFNSNADAKGISATFNNSKAGGNAIGLGSSLAYNDSASADWIYAALTYSFNPETGLVTASRMITQAGVNGGAMKTVNNNTVTLTANCMSTAEMMVLGKFSTGMGDRGTGFCFADFRIYDRVLTETEVKALSNEVDDAHEVLHLDFLGNTQSEKLTDKATAGTNAEVAVLGNAGNLSKIENGIAEINEAAGNYMTVDLSSTDIKNQNQLTFFAAYKAEGTTPNNLVELVNQTNVIRWSFNTNNSVGVTFGSAGTFNPVASYPVGEWIYEAVTYNYNPTAKTVTAVRFVSFNLGTTWTKSSARTTTVTANPMANAGTVTLGKFASGMGDRGRTISFKDFRIFNSVLSDNAIYSLHVEEPASMELDQSLITHYDFLGENPLADKAVAGSAKTAATLAGSASGVKNGVAYVDHAAGNYISFPINTDDLKNANSATFFMVFKPEGQGSNVADVLNAGDVLRIMYNGNSATTTIAANFNPNKAAAASADGVDHRVFASTNNYTYSYETDAPFVTMAFTYSYNPATKQATATRFEIVNGQWLQTYTYTRNATYNILPLANNVVLGKVNTTIADRDTSFYYKDFRLYNKALTLDELKTLSVKEYASEETRDINDNLKVQYDFIGKTGEEMLTDKVSGQVMKLVTTKDGSGNDLSYVKDGKAYVDQAKGNYLLTNPLTSFLGTDKTATLFLAFSAVGSDNAAANTDLATISQNIRLYFNNSNDLLGIRLADAVNAGTESNTAIQKTVTRGADATNYVAVTLQDDGAGNMAVYLYFSADQGATWMTFIGQGYTNAEKALSDVNKFLLLGKAGIGTGDFGISLIYDEVRIYDTKLTLDELKTIVVKEAPAAATICGMGVQTGTASNGTLAVRFLAGVEIWDEEQIDCFGFTVSMEGAGTGTATVKTVYRSILAAGEEVSASELGGDYVFAFVLSDFANDQTYNFTQIQAFCKLKDGTTLYGTTGSCSLVSGEIA